MSTKLEAAMLECVPGRRRPAEQQPEVSLAPMDVETAHALLAAFPFPAMLIDARHRIIATNDATCHLAGVSPEQLCGKYCPTALHGCDAPVPDCPLELCLAAESGAVEVEICSGERWFRSGVYPVAFRSSEGGAVFLHTSVDITTAKRSKLELEAAKVALQRKLDAERVVSKLLQLSTDRTDLRTLLASALETILSTPWLAIERKGAIFVSDAAGGPLRMAASLGLEPEVVEACSALELGRCLCGRAAQTASVVQSTDLDERHEVRTAGMRPHGHFCAPLLFRGEVLGVLNTYLTAGQRLAADEEAFLRSVANTLAGIVARWKSEQQREELRCQFFQAQKLEAVGRLAGGIAHDFNNLLSIIQNAADLLREEASSPQASEDCEVIQNAARRAAELTRQLLTFSRRDELQLELLNVRQMIESFAPMLRRMLGDQIQLGLEYHAPLDRVRADRGSFSQVILNLAINARDAMQEGGRLTIETVPLNNSELFPRGAALLDSAPDSCVVLRVSDQGAGIPAHILDDIFEPVFTTKGDAGGSGLGLAMVHGAVAQMGGQVRVASKEGHGTVFEVCLPLAEEPADVGTPAA